jgi:hypothetical protein
MTDAAAPSGNLIHRRRPPCTIIVKGFLNLLENRLDGQT